MNVLIVEDDILLQKVMSIELRILGLPLRFAESGQDALERIKEQVPSVLVLDVRLPDMSGFDLIEQLRKNSTTMGLPLIIHTSIDLTADESERLTLGPTRIITKTRPGSDILANVIRELIDELV